MPRLVRERGNNSISIQFKCNQCVKEFVNLLENYMKSYMCPSCHSRVDTLPIHCDLEDCAERHLGRYIRCVGTIRRLTAEERTAEERKTIESEQEIFNGARPTGSFHEDMQDIRSSMIAYKCDTCGDSCTLGSGISRGYDSGTVLCRRFFV